MSGNKMRQGVAVAVAMMATLLLAVAAHSSTPEFRHAFSYDLKAITPLTAARTVDFSLTMRRDSLVVGCTDVSIRIETIIGRFKVLSAPVWDAHFDGSDPYSTIISIQFSPHDTCGLRIRVLCKDPTGTLNGCGDRSWFYFVATDDSLIRLSGDPRDASKPWPNPDDVPPGGYPVPGQFPKADSVWGILKVEPVSLPKHAGPVDMRLSFSPARHPCDSVKFKVGTRGGIIHDGESIWTVPLVQGVPIDTVIRVTIQDSARAGLYVTMWCGDAVHQAERRFFTIHDTLEYYSIHPWHPKDAPPVP